MTLRHCTTYLFLSTLSLRRATKVPLAESTAESISIHALLAESDVNGICLVIYVGGFLSTLSLRRATTANRTDPSAILDFYPRSPCGERRFDSGTFVPAEKFLSTLSLRRATSKNAAIGKPTLISIHALLAESDKYCLHAAHLLIISIHALLAESDNVRITHNPGPGYFYPRSPCGERHILPL